MKKHPKIIISILILSVILIAILSIFLFQKYKMKQNIDFVYEQTSNVQDNIENITDINDLYLKINGNNVIGVIEIEKINYEGLIYESTSMDVLDKGIGHFESSSLFEGNVCLAGHNYYYIWKNLHTLEKGDTVKYTCILGQKTYSVCDVKEINDNDISVLDNTQNNMITLITCIKNTPSKRLCVQAVEI